jgi:hypothetical protein
MRIANNGDISFYEDTGTTPKLFWDASAERLGIGTSSPAQKLDVAGDVRVQNAVKFKADDGSENGWITLSDDDNFSIRSFGTAGIVTFTTGSGDTERMRIDSSGNLLVGKTSASKDTVGAEMKADGRINATMTSTAPILANRKTTDGDIALFQKDGSTVGSIGTQYGDLTIGTGDTGILFTDGSDAIAPYNPSSVAFRDGLIDIGVSSQRFKDLYLSGGVYLGGTGSANHLDDYEEGTWTATMTTDGTDFSTSNRSTDGFYRKIGNQVTVWFGPSITNPTGGTGNFIVSGLPFTPVHSNNMTVTGGGINFGRFDLTASKDYFSYISHGSSNIGFRYNIDNSNPGWVTAADLNGNITPYLSGHITYTTS